MEPTQSVDESSRFRPLRREEYERLVEMGAFAREKVELIHGRIVRMSPQGHPHVYAVLRLTNILAPAVHNRALVQVQSPIATEDSEPEPDVAILPLDGVDTGIATRAHLLIEVAESSLANDRREKLPLYAAAGFPEVWLVDVNGRAVFVHRGPTGDAWSEVFRVEVDGAVSPLAFPDVVVRVADLFLPKK